MSSTVLVYYVEGGHEKEQLNSHLESSDVEVVPQTKSTSVRRKHTAAADSCGIGIPRKKRGYQPAVLPLLFFFVLLYGY